VRPHLDHLSEETAQLVILAVSELATNAVVHARTTFEVRISAGAGSTTVIVSDGDPTIPTPRSADDLASGGRGLATVQAAAVDWGIRPQPGGKQIWFRVET
jgi:anti-sigma regulatory factor (Ser/Thr protein kinase)